ncbi:hypothetical protein [Reyranella sp. CPCC 100927]|uniref:hypothetical protein n=1 Tax=Reyranella sp. CPCC 100927 TaxID=2599616 RepID=UPI001C49AB35|nr:hypothetical protein [Reyranella sp. CPCC 100927]
MGGDPQQLFDFGRRTAAAQQSIALVRQFAAHTAFRSAMVEELELDEDFHRRPLRPEDLSFIDFTTPVVTESAFRLPFLAAQRLLLCANELEMARPPRDGSSAAFEKYLNFHSEENRTLAAQIKPFLEDFAFDFLCGEDAAVPSVESCVAQLAVLLQTEMAFWGDVFDHLVSTRYVEGGLGYILIQKQSLAGSKRVAFGKAGAMGYFDHLSPQDWPKLAQDETDQQIVRRLAELCGIAKGEHSYWQFYLSTSLAECNLLHALAARPGAALALSGAAFAAEATWLAFRGLIAQAGPCLRITNRDDLAGRRSDAANELLARFARVLGRIEHQYGLPGLRLVRQGLTAASALAGHARRNLEEQLNWLASVESYRDIARQISARIEVERPDIDRETFVEPREMCSTTHVHDDHRLVVIETGNMVFWGNVGMKLRLAPGEMVLVPEGRLHGSSIESDECVYHQPIIPDEWVRPLVRDRATASAAA